VNQTSRRLIIALMISVSINIFLIGFVMARFLLDSRPRKEYGERNGRIGAAQTLDDPKPIRRLLLKNTKNFEPKRKALREARQKVTRALVAVPFDSDTLKASLSDIRDNTQTSQIALHNALAGLAESLTPQERQKLSRSPYFMREEKQLPKPSRVFGLTTTRSSFIPFTQYEPNVVVGINVPQ
jgi:uncharacterized membrane protein